MIGIGYQPAGVTLAGLGAPEALAPLPIPESGAPHISLTGDYVINTKTGDVGRDRSARHRVLMAIRTLSRSAAADGDFGLKKPDIITESFDAEMKANAMHALRFCTYDNSVRIDDIKVINGGGRVQLTIEFTDMLTQAKDKVTV